MRACASALRAVKKRNCNDTEKKIGVLLGLAVGDALGCGAHLSKLVRERAGPFSLNKALSLEQTEKAFASLDWPLQLYSVDTVFLHLRAAIIGKEMEKHLQGGSP